MKNLFIDSNIWLSLYHFTNDDLAQFGKLKDLIDTDIKIFLTQQVYDEIIRNRENKINDSFKSFEVKSIKYPAFCKGYDEYESIKDDYKDIMKRFQKWKSTIEKDVHDKNLPADKTIHEFFEAVEIIPVDDFVDKAFSRYKIGNPPGKDNKYGDAINWECLLSVVPDGEDLYFISDDKDYRSEIFDEMFNPFLNEEWKRKKNSKIIYYKKLVPFLSEHIKDIELRSEQNKQDMIDALKHSGFFARTHELIKGLNQYSEWSIEQIDELCEAVVENNQVRWIIGDDDVFEFYDALLDGLDYQSLEDGPVKAVLDLINSIKSEDNESRHI